jgi:hypothetical protein
VGIQDGPAAGALNLEGCDEVRSSKQGPSRDSFYELEIGIMFAAIAAIVLVTLGGNLDLSILF